jgi:hypothetical protein
MTSRITRGIVEFHLASKLMWCIFTMVDLFALLKETARLRDRKTAIGRLARKSIEWTGEIAGMVERARRGETSSSHPERTRNEQMNDM